MKSLGLVWLPSFGLELKNSFVILIINLFGCHRIDPGIHLEFQDFHLMHNLNTYLVPCHFNGTAK
jgi:hypothetical protein